MWPGWREVRVRNASGGTYVGLKGNKSKEFRMALQKEKREKKEDQKYTYIQHVDRTKNKHGVSSR